jgi:tRNA splicing endonuclease
MSKPERKKWAVKQASIILEERGESNVMDNIKTKAKKDDLSDVICQLQAYKFLCRDGVYSDL